MTHLNDQDFDVVYDPEFDGPFLLRHGKCVSCGWGRYQCACVPRKGMCHARHCQRVAVVVGGRPRSYAPNGDHTVGEWTPSCLQHASLLRAGTPYVELAPTHPEQLRRELNTTRQGYNYAYPGSSAGRATYFCH